MTRTRKKVQGPQKPHHGQVKLATEKQEIYRSPVSICASNCFTEDEQVHIDVHVTSDDVAGLSGDGLNVVCNGLLIGIDFQ